MWKNLAEWRDRIKSFANDRPVLKRSVLWLFFTFIGGLLPTWGALAVFCLFGQKLSVALFVANGEFALYAASLVATMFYTLAIERERMPLRGWFMAVGLLFVVFATIVFSATLLASKSALVKTFSINMTFLASSTLILYLLSVVIVYCVTVLDMLYPPKDPMEVRNSQVDDLARSVREES